MSVASKTDTGAGKAKKSDRASANTPQTGAEYLDSLRDDRTIYIYGDRVKDVTTHPAFRNTARMVARQFPVLRVPSVVDDAPRMSPYHLDWSQWHGYLEQAGR